MKEIKNKFNIWDEVVILQNERREKENTILSCISLIEKGVDTEKENLQNRQRGISLSLIQLNDDITLKMDNIIEILKGVSSESVKDGKISFDLLSYCFYNRIPKEKLSKLKEIIKAVSTEKYLDIPMNQKLRRAGITYRDYLLKKSLRLKF